MGRPTRQSAKDIIYHVINRSNGRFTIFKKDADYQAFETILEEAKQKYPIRILAYSIMPNHWHLLLKPYNDGDLSLFMRTLTLTHTQRWHAHYHRVGDGHLYQGRFKSFPVQEDEYFIQVAKYIERNALRASLVKKAEDWRWSSIWRRVNGKKEDKDLLSEWPIPPERNYLTHLNQIQDKAIEEAIVHSIEKGSPYGETSWMIKIAQKLGLGSTLKPRGRPKK